MNVVLPEFRVAGASSSSPRGESAPLPDLDDEAPATRIGRPSAPLCPAAQSGPVSARGGGAADASGGRFGFTIADLRTAFAVPGPPRHAATADSGPVSGSPRGSGPTRGPRRRTNPRIP